MLLKTILNRVERHKGFVYEDFTMKLSSGKVEELRILVRPREGSRPVCSGCGVRRAGYDHLSERRFNYVPLWGIPVVLIYCMRRVQCPACGIKLNRFLGRRGSRL